jgi:hypothetical protein
MSGCSGNIAVLNNRSGMNRIEGVFRIWNVDSFEKVERI